MTPRNITEIFPFEACGACEVCKPYLKKVDPDDWRSNNEIYGTTYILTCSHTDACEQFSELLEEYLEKDS